MYNPNGNHYTMMDGGSGWLLGFAILTAVLLLIAVSGMLAHLFLHSSHRENATCPAGPSPNEPTPAVDTRLVPDGRLAHGQVTPEEYRAGRPRRPRRSRKPKVLRRSTMDDRDFD